MRERGGRDKLLLFAAGSAVSGADAHGLRCNSLCYEGRHRVRDPDRWMLGWRITGPRKRQRIASLFVRVPGSGSRAAAAGNEHRQLPSRYLK